MHVDTFLGRIVGEPFDTYGYILTRQYSCKIIKGARNQKKFFKFLDIYISTLINNNSLYVKFNLMRSDIHENIFNRFGIRFK